MTTKEKMQLTIGIVLLVALVTPVILLSVPRTYTGVGFVVEPGSSTAVPVVTDVVRVPLVIFFQAVDGTWDDVLFFGVYAGLLALAIWLVVRGRRYRLKEA